MSSRNGEKTRYVITWRYKDKQKSTSHVAWAFPCTVVASRYLERPFAESSAQLPQLDTEKNGAWERHSLICSCSRARNNTIISLLGSTVQAIPSDWIVTFELKCFEKHVTWMTEEFSEAHNSQSKHHYPAGWQFDCNFCAAEKYAQCTAKSAIKMHF